MNQRIEQLFARSKLLCFGRYALEVPQDAKFIWGSDLLYTLPNRAKDVDKIVAAKRSEILAKSRTAEITYSGQGPAPNVMWIRSYDDAAAKQVGLEGFDIFYVVGPHIFQGANATAKSARSTVETITERTLFVAQNLRLRVSEDIPKEPGLCMEYGFLRNSPPDRQESFAVGLTIPSLPDVTFSIQSNKNASTKGSNSDSLLKQINDRRKELGERYPKLTTLREGKRTVHGWAGEESLVRRADGTHDFEWKFIGESGNVARPALLDVTMFSKVKADRIGAAAASSVNDEEAMALWDRLLEGLKFRVAVPGAPADAVAIQ